MTVGLLWVDKYRPKTLETLDIHSEWTEKLTSLCEQRNLPHLLFYGPSGAGKRTRIHAVLRQIFGSAIDKRKVEHRFLKVGEPPKEVELTTITSAHHIELCPADVGYNDRLVIQEIVKEIASSKPIELGSVHHGYKVVVLHDIDGVSKQAQQALRRTMEKYTSCCRIIMSAESVTRVMEPIRSRCLGIRIPCPKKEEMKQVLQKIAKKEGLVLPDFFADKLVTHSEGNLRKAILLLEVCRAVAYPFPQQDEDEDSWNSSKFGFEWERICYEIANTVIREQNPKQLSSVRNKLYDLFCHAIPGDVIFRKITIHLLRMVDEEVAPSICHWAAFYEHGMKQGSKEVFHLEAFLAKVMYIYYSHIHTQYSMALDDV
ncbi:hypothetical protein GpartN1_g7088.t1 [Galdieria partita]|uniref:Replication factor C subunit 3 n=1 Tax=Galdieria partita TaxID=83374 RepID=A0A9C7Q5E2_9RHOD|nr:hypothetical protein GpartN1_g7088.t1 [Galdieria partita]